MNCEKGREKKTEINTFPCAIIEFSYTGAAVEQLLLLFVSVQSLFKQRHKGKSFVIVWKIMCVCVCNDDAWILEMTATITFHRKHSEILNT